MRIYVSAFWLLLVLICSCFAQDDGPDLTSPPEEKVKPIKFDEFGDISEREFGPKLARYIAENTGWRTTKFVVIYNSYNNSPFKRNSYYVSGKKAAYMRYLRRSSYQGADVLFINGGFMDKWRTELWVSPSDLEADRPPIDKRARATTGRAEFIGERMFTVPAALDEAKIGGNKADQDKTGDGDEEEADGDVVVDGDTDPDNADPADEVDDSEPEPDPPPERSFSFEFLKEHKEARAVLIFYLDEAVFDLAKSRQLIKAQLDEHIAKFKLDPSWVKIIYGGYRETPEMEGWAVPGGGPDPEPMPQEKIDDN